MNRTFFEKSENKKKWFVVDADRKNLGRIASRIAAILKGKHKPTYTPFIDTGDFVIVINADKISYTGKKKTDKIYYHHTMYPAGLRAVSLGKIMEEKPEEAIKKAVWGMLPKGRLGRDMFRKLKVYAGDKHSHQAQKPEYLEL